MTIYGETTFSLQSEGEKESTKTTYGETTFGLQSEGEEWSTKTI